MKVRHGLKETWRGLLKADSVNYTSIRDKRGVYKLSVRILGKRKERLERRMKRVASGEWVRTYGAKLGKSKIRL